MAKRKRTYTQFRPEERMPDRPKEDKEEEVVPLSPSPRVVLVDPEEERKSILERAKEQAGG